MSNPRYRVPGPTFTPSPFGVLTVAQVVDDPDPHWRNGLEWEVTPANGDTAAVTATLAPCYDVVDPEDDTARIASSPIPKSPGGSPTFGDGDAFTLYAFHQCSTIGRTRDEDIARAGTMLTDGEPFGLASVILTGTTEAGILPRSLVRNADTVAPTQPTVRKLVATLEGDLAAAYRGVGTIWLPRGAALLAFGDYLLVQQGNRLTTGVGTPVVVLPDTVFDDPQDPTSVAAFATGPLTVYRGGVATYEAVDRDTNTRGVVAERTYAVAIDDPILRADLALDAP